ncbi:uncharacterized protein LOC116965536 [Tyto alba]|uniref:uncharacterized protein LOC116965536 n=1 Tax=Tyto alba TaxID=56313 RepID=UPI001C686404|nr:uncharacterized protein LOC116965536 [Tyto alba]
MGEVRTSDRNGELKQELTTAVVQPQTKCPAGPFHDSGGGFGHKGSNTRQAERGSLSRQAARENGGEEGCCKAHRDTRSGSDRAGGWMLCWTRGGAGSESWCFPQSPRPRRSSRRDPRGTDFVSCCECNMFDSIPAGENIFSDGGAEPAGAAAGPAQRGRRARGTAALSAPRRCRRNGAGTTAGSARERWPRGPPAPSRGHLRGSVSGRQHLPQPRRGRDDGLPRTGLPPNLSPFGKPRNKSTGLGIL